MLKLAIGQEPSSVEREVSGSFGNFYVTIQPFTLGQRVRYWTAQYADQFDEVMKTRIEHVIGWRDVLDEQGEPIPFNRSNLDSLLAANHTIFAAVCNVAHAVFSEDATVLSEAERKN